METSPRGYDVIRAWEGRILRVYRDPLKYPTVGYGHLIRDFERHLYPLGKEITLEHAEVLLRMDVKPCERAVSIAIEHPLNQNQYDALIDWLFNCGHHAVYESQVRRAINRQDYTAVPKLLELWCKGRVDGELRVIQGLLNRRRHEGMIWSSPIDAVVKMGPAEKDRVEIEAIDRAFGVSLVTLDELTRHLAEERRKQDLKRIDDEYDLALEKEIAERHAAEKKPWWKRWFERGN